MFGIAKFTKLVHALVIIFQLFKARYMRRALVRGVRKLFLYRGMANLTFLIIITKGRKNTKKFSVEFKCPNDRFATLKKLVRATQLTNLTYLFFDSSFASMISSFVFVNGGVRSE